MSQSFPCPRCGEVSTWENNEFRPFCSDRCKLIDLGAWANDEYNPRTQEAPSSERHAEE